MKKQKTKLAFEPFSKDLVGNATGYLQPVYGSVPCNSKCFNKVENGFGCAALTRERATLGKTGFVKVHGLESKRRERLVAHLRTCVFFDGTAFRFQFALPGSFGLPKRVCEHFYAAVLGMKKGDRMYKNVMVQVRQEVMTRTSAIVTSYTSVLVSCNMAGSLDQIRERRGRNTVHWLARFIMMFAMPLPMRRELRFDFANRARLYQYLRKDLTMQLHMSVEDTTDSHLVGVDRFYQMIRTPYHALVVDAISAKVGTAVQDGTYKTWKLNFLDPSKLRDFRVCSTCALNAQMRRQATANGNKPAFDHAMRLVDVHQKAVQARRHHFVWTQREASDNTTQRLAMTCDAMEHSKLDGPILPCGVRWSKLKSDTVMPAHLVHCLPNSQKK